MTKSRRRRMRSSAGVSLTELLVASILLGGSLAVVAELMSLCVVSNNRLFRQFDAQAGANFALDRIKRDVRMAKQIRVSTDEFAVQKYLSSKTLILRIPVFYLDKQNDPGSPTYDASKPQNQLNGFELRGHYTVVYEVVADPERLGEFMLTSSTFRSLPDGVLPDCAYHEAKDAQVLIKGITGPVEVGGGADPTPKVFSYIAKNPLHEERLDIVQETALYRQEYVDLLSGIGIDLELIRGDSGNVVDNNTATRSVGVHSEVCLRLPQTVRVGLSDENFYEP